MARKRIREYTAKKIILKRFNQDYQAILINPKTDLENFSQIYPWLNENQLTVKPDQLFGKRKKLGLVLLNATFEEVKEYLQNHRNKEITIGKATDKLTHFLIEPYLEHEKEYYLSFSSKRNHDLIIFSEEGGINIEENWGKITEIKIPTLSSNIEEQIPLQINESIRNFIKELFQLYQELDFTYLEINPFTIKDNQINLLDTVAKVDDCSDQWRNHSFPNQFGRKTSLAEEHLNNIDKNSGASLKLTLLNPEGRIWNILSGGGASIIYLDTIANLGKANEIANYGEYSGNPSTEESYQYAKTILELMTKNHHPEGKVLLIGGAIANFTDIEKTFQGIVQALQEYKEKLQQGKISVYVRRGGPNYKQGLQLMKKAELEIPLEIFGPETNLTKIVALAGEKLK